MKIFKYKSTEKSSNMALLQIRNTNNIINEYDLDIEIYLFFLSAKLPNYCSLNTQRPGPENLKQSRSKKLAKSNKSIPRIFLFFF